MNIASHKMLRWITDSAIPSYFVQLFISTIGAILIAIIAVAIPAILVAAMTKNNSGGNFVDHLVEQRIFVLLNEPYFIVPILTSFWLGIASHRLFRSTLAAWVWTVPCAMLSISVASWKGDVWNTYFGSQCGSSECAYEWLVTLPLYTSVAYSLGWVSRRLCFRT